MSSGHWVLTVIRWQWGVESPYCVGARGKVFVPRSSPCAPGHARGLALPRPPGSQIILRVHLATGNCPPSDCPLATEQSVSTAVAILKGAFEELGVDRYGLGRFLGWGGFSRSLGRVGKIVGLFVVV